MAALHASQLAVAVPMLQTDTFHVDAAELDAHEMRYAPPVVVPDTWGVLKHDLVGCQALMTALPLRQLASPQEATVAVVPADADDGAEIGGTTRSACRGGEVMVVPTLAAAASVQSSTIDPPSML